MAVGVLVKSRGAGFFIDLKYEKKIFTDIRHFNLFYQNILFYWIMVNSIET